ncbi:MAG: dihydrodipicolinate synthase family protein, partial [Armatimonadota bacterium]|nr:dihydrodipicolinate synthase family protein [Armatimonadota bacterium]
MAATLPQGVYTALVTPLSDGGEVDYSAFSPLIEWQRQHGVVGVVVCGTTGEAPSLSVEERERVIATVREKAPDLRVVAGTGCSNLPETIRLSRFAQQQGCDAVLVIPPFYYKDVSEEGLLAYYWRLLDAVQVPVLLYHYPQLAGVDITPALVERLLDYPHLIGLKDSSGDWETLLAFLLRFPRLQVFVGTENLIADAVASGAAGCISGLANALPEWIVRVTTAALRREDASAQNEHLKAIVEAVDAVPFVPAVKQICAWRGLPSMTLRPPLCSLSPQQADALHRTLG